MKKTFGIILFCIQLLNPLFSQQTTDLKQVFLAAESYYLFEEFEEALPLYLRLHRTYSDNYNLYFKIGVCYLNDAYEKDKSVFYLEKASKNINPKYKESNFKELGAPPESMFFLGNAYRINNELDKAREAYKKFQSQMDTEIYDDKLVLEQLASCDVAEKLMKKPVDMDIEIMSNQINTRFADKNPTVSGDETKLVFISKLQFYDAVFFSEKKDGKWTAPRNITPELGVDGDVYPTSLSYDGTLLFIYRNDDFTGNIYTSALVNGNWTPLVKLNENINTKYWESHASVAKDGRTLYFTSNRKGGFGGLDIYKSEKLETGDWGPPVNLGATINSPYNEETPFITENGRRLFFSSYGHYNMGGYDVFMSVLDSENAWASPLNMGYPLNSTDDDLFFCPVKDGEIAYFPVYKETGYGRHDIYRYKVYTADHPRRYDISGILNYTGGNIPGSEVDISVISQVTGDTVAVTNPDDSGRFSFSVPAGKYSMVFESKNFEKLIKSLEVNQNTPRTGISLNEQFRLIPLPVKPSKEEMDSWLQIEDSVLIITKNKPVTLDFEAEKGTVVVVKQYLDSVLVKIDTIQIDKRRQSYEFVPQPGLNQIEFTLTDENGNQVTKTVNAAFSEDGDASDLLSQIPAKSLAPVDEAEKESRQENIQALVNDLATRADGQLKVVLQNLDLDKEGITNTGELFKYLYENSEKLNYTNEDVDHLFMEIAGKKDLAEFLIHLKNASEGNLKSTISGLDLTTNNIRSPLQAVDYLIRNSKNSGYLPEDVVKSLSIVGAKGETDQSLFINKLIQSSDEGALKVYLKTLDLNNPDPATSQDFAVALYRNSAGKPFTEADVLAALTNLAVNSDAAIALKKLTDIAPEGKLKDFLKALDLQKEGIYSAEQLIDHLYANADMKGFTREDTDRLLQDYLYDQVSEIDELRNKMAALSTGNLKEYLEKTDLNQNSFGSREELIDFLKTEAVKKGFSIDEVNNALLKLSYSGDLDDITKRLSLNASGKLQEVIANINLEKEGITTFDELIRYLLDNSEQLGYTKEDVYKMLSDYTTSTDLELFMSRLIRLADPETKLYLENLDLTAESIDDRGELITYLLKKALEGSVNQEKMIRLLLRATETSVSEILPVLQSRSTGDLNKLLNSAKLPVKEFISAADLYDYLISSTEKDKSILKSDINNLFSEYLSDNSLNQFLGQMIYHSNGKLREFLQKINLKVSGISSVSGLIQYLIENAESNGYSESDVFSLIQKVLGREKLEDFIARLREFAPPGLVVLLDQLNLNESGIHSIEDLMKYLSENATAYGYTMEDVWNAVLQLVISGEDRAGDDSVADMELSKSTTGKTFLYGAGILALSGILVLLLILIKRKKDKK